MSIPRVAAFLALLLPLSGWAQQWEGNAARIRPGEFETPGLYAASNSFPQGTRVRVASASSGKSVEVTVTRRVNGTSGIFLLLSDQAADALGLATGDVARIVAAPVAPLAGGDIAASSALDPDDPRSGLSALLQELRGTEPAAAPVAAPAPAPAPAVVAAVEPAPEQPLAEAVSREPQKELFQPPHEAALPPEAAQAGPPPVVEPPPQPEPVAAAAPQPEPSQFASQLAREPQKQLFLQPREEEIAVTTVPERPSIVAAASAELEEPPLPDVPAEPEPVAETGPEASDAPPRLAEAPLVEPPLASPEPPVEAAAAPEPVETGPVVTAGAPAPPAEAPAPAVQLAEAPQPEAPAEPTPPVVAAVAPPEPAPAPVPPPAAQPAPAVARVAPPGDRAYYVQLGAFADESTARDLERLYRANYPIDVQPTARNGRSIYRVVVGPLGRDETGSVLQRFQALGFRDAFVRSVN